VSTDERMRERIIGLLSWCPKLAPLSLRRPASLCASHKQDKRTPAHHQTQKSTLPAEEHIAPPVSPTAFCTLGTLLSVASSVCSSVHLLTPEAIIAIGRILRNYGNRYLWQAAASAGQGFALWDRCAILAEHTKNPRQERSRSACSVLSLTPTSEPMTLSPS